jgi:hypothetical protein
MVRKSKTSPKEVPSRKAGDNQRLAEDVKFEQAREEIKKLVNSGVDETEQAVTKIAVQPEDNEEEKKVIDEANEPTENFVTFYKNNDNEKVDMTTIERKDPNRKKKIVGLVIFILVLLLIVTLLGFYFFVQRGDKFSENDIVITPITALSVASGDQFSFTVEIQNKSSIAIQDVELTLQGPAEFIYVNASPKPSNESLNQWQLNTIKGNSSKQVEITGVISAERGAVENFNTVISYRPANFNSDFSKTRSFSQTISDSVLGLDLAVPTKVVSGRSADYQVTLTNNAKDKFSKVRLTLTIPQDLSAVKFNPPATKDDTIWEFNSLEAKQSKTITWQGTVSAEEGSARELKVEVGYVDEQGQYHQQSDETAIIFVVNPQLFLNLSVNDSSGNGTTHFGGQLSYSLKYRNDSQSEIKNMTIAAVFTGDVLDWQSLIMPVPGTVGDNRIEWNATSIPALTSVKPGAEGEILFTIKVKDSIVAQKPSDKNYSLISQATATSKEVVDLEGTKLEVESNAITTKLTSRVDLRTEGRYYDDQFLPVGKGPVPPEVGSTTTYQIYWYLRNNANEIKDVVVSAVIPANVVWMNDSIVSAGNLKFDATTRTVTWSVNKVPPQVGQTIPELEARFAVQITPLASDVGSFMTLLNATEARATDTFTTESIVQSKEALTTDLTSDPQAAGKGTVVVPVATNTNSTINSQ